MKHFIIFYMLGLLAGTVQAQHEHDHGQTSPALIDQNSSAHQGCVPKVSDIDWYSSPNKAPLFDGLEGIEYEIEGASVEVMNYFRQGLMLSYAFNHAESAGSFYETMRIDPGFAMGYWGYALVLGPNYNAAMEEDNFERAYDASRKALQLSEGTTGKDRDLIVALSERYIAHPGPDRSDLDQAYASAMKAVYQKYPEDNDIAALYVESLMDLHPWDLWGKSGDPRPWTPEIVEILETILERAPEHAGAAHFYIHAVEASKTPERALPQAEILQDLVPGAGHLVHMPSHVYIRTGHYHQGSLANLRAVAVDGDYVETCHAYGVYPLAYYPHNYHFLAATATLEGNRELAVMAARRVNELTDPALMREPGWGTVQHYYTIPYYVMVKFGMWEELEKEPMPAEDLKYPVAVMHYAKGMAALGKGNTKEAKKHLASLKELAADPDIKEISIWDINTAGELLAIAENLLQGEISASNQSYDTAISSLEEAVRLEDHLNYNEPPDWFFSVRHHLGAVLLEDKQYARAKEVYLKDLENYPENGWALAGLIKAYEGLGEASEAESIRERFDDAWQFADASISYSRIK
ncbi:MAG: tetratricopeptide repeat protein [Bacteroidales bacterium]